MRKVLIVTLAALAAIACQGRAQRVERAFEAPAAVSSAAEPVSITGMTRIEDKGYFYQPGKWPSMFIPVCWDNPSPADATERQWVEDAINRS